MHLVICVLAAVVSTVVWYMGAPKNQMRVDTLCYMFWGASLMWFVDAIFEYSELGAAYFTPEPLDMLNDIYLGLSVVALALVIWVVILMVKDPRGVRKHTA